MDNLIIYGLAATAVLLLILVFISKARSKRRINFRERISLDSMMDGEITLKEDKPIGQADTLSESQNQQLNQPSEGEYGYIPETVSNSANEKGTALLKAGKTEESITFFNKAIIENPADAWAYYNRGLAKSKLNLMKDAIDDFTDAMLRQLNSPDAFYQRGKIRIKIGDKESALRDFSEFISLDQSNADAYFLKGTLEFDNENYEVAINDFSNAIVLDKNHADSYFKRGMAKHFTGYTVGACKDLKTAFEKGNLEAFHYLKLYCN